MYMIFLVAGFNKYLTLFLHLFDNMKLSVIWSNVTNNEMSVLDFYTISFLKYYFDIYVTLRLEWQKPSGNIIFWSDTFSIRVKKGKQYRYLKMFVSFIWLVQKLRSYMVERMYIKNKILNIDGVLLQEMKQCPIKENGSMFHIWNVHLKQIFNEIV